MTYGYEATMKLAAERPELVPLVRLIFDMGDEAFSEGLRELVRRGILTTDVLPAAMPG